MRAHDIWIQKTEMDGEGEQLPIVSPGFTRLVPSPSWLEIKVPVFGLGIGEWITEVNNAIANRDHAISSNNAITVLVLVRSYHVESRNQRLRKSAPQYLSMPAIAF